MRRCGPTPALTIFVAYAPTSSYEEEEEVEAFYMDLEKFYRDDHAFYKVIISDFNAKVGSRRTPEELHNGTHGLQWNDQGERLSEFIMPTKTIHGNLQLQKPSSLRWTWVEGTVMKYTTSSSIKIIYDFYSDLFDSHVHLPPHHLREDGHVIPEVLPFEIQHAIISVRNRTKS
ncbi:hypothetical protein RB195_014613 [Necator americanus]|uniref:Endonuclease/exonuclease/phosphatase domain-containing protein n=1 Tax=Necator americanus TaxID=51031 RepID=A0ABR1E1C8_NECAM